MSVLRVMGLENEYGITSENATDPITLSNRIVFAYSKYVYPNSSMRWDYDLENPLRDARGFDLTRSEADASLLTDEDQSIPNIILPNGARFYVDHAHPEYASPEVLSPLEILKWDLAGEKIMQKAVEMDSKDFPNDKIRIFKNNVDNKGASYGTHENYLTKRDVDFNQIIAGLTAHFVTRSIYCGAGRVGLGQLSESSGFQISQRADYIEAHVGLETTMRRPIINTRDEPHADPNLYRRIHVINGDANMSDWSNVLKVGTTSLIIKMIEEGLINPDELQVKNPVDMFSAVSRDLDCGKTYEMSNGKKFTAIDIQEILLEKAKTYLNIAGIDAHTTQIISMWEEVLQGLKFDKDSLDNRVDWIAKQSIILKYQNRNNLKIDDPVIKSIDLQYSEITSNNGIAQVLRSKNLLVNLINQEEIIEAVNEPPTTTRAWLRGKVLAKFSAEVSAASWDSIIMDVDKSKPLFRISTPDPHKMTKKLSEDLINSSNSATDLVTSLQSGEYQTKL